MSLELPLASTAPPERNDAARNRAKVVEAAAKLFRERAVGGVDMRDIAGEAGVGVGTLYRRFGDKASLVASVLDTHARALQDAILTGPPPLGPGAPPEERLEAFLCALVDLIEDEFELIYAVEHSGPGRFGIGPYPAWRLHATVLCADLAPGFDATWLAEALLAPLASGLYRHQRIERGLTKDEIKEQLTALARAVYGSRA